MNHFSFEEHVLLVAFVCANQSNCYYYIKNSITTQNELQVQQYTSEARIDWRMIRWLYIIVPRDKTTQKNTNFEKVFSKRIYFWIFKRDHVVSGARQQNSKNDFGASASTKWCRLNWSWHFKSNVSTTFRKFTEISFEIQLIKIKRCPIQRRLKFSQGRGAATPRALR